MFYRDFNKEPVYLFNCPSVSVINSTFINNTSTAQYLFRPFEANAAGLSYGWNNILLDTQASVDVHVYNCMFINNIARAVKRNHNPVNDGIQRGVFPGRGGGMAVVLRTMSNVTVVIEKTKFIGNHANVFGGGLFLLMYGVSINQYFYISNDTFENNTATFGGAAINVGFVCIIPQFTVNRFIIKDSNIINNQAELGGAIGIGLTYTFGLTNFITINNCNFHSNQAGFFGAAIILIHFNLFSPKTKVKPIEIIDW